MFKLSPTESQYILLDSGKAYLVKPDDLKERTLRDEKNRPMWILVDANASPDGIPAELRVLSGPKPMVVYSTSPQQSRWKLVKGANIRLSVIIMNAWSKWEAELL
jgi:hypothetical protein